MPIPMYEDVMQNSSPGDATERADVTTLPDDPPDTMSNMGAAVVSVPVAPSGSLDVSGLASQAGGAMQQAVAAAPSNVLGWAAAAALAWWIFS